MKTASYSFTASDGKKIHVHRWLPDGETRSILLVAHGMAEHGARYARLAERLTAAGWAVYAPDHRGHGLTAAREEELGWFADKDGFRRVVDDLHELGQAARAEQANKPLFLYGHSMGSLLSQAYIAAYGAGLAACALSGVPEPVPGPLVAAGTVIATFGGLVKGWKTKSPLLDSMSFGSFNKALGPTRTKFDWLSRDPAEVDKYVADPRCGFLCSFSFFRDLLGGASRAYSPESMGRIPKELPLYMFAGDADPCGGATGGFKKLHERYVALGIKDLSMRLYPGARHEVLNETNRDEVTADLVAWLGERLR
ncbi:MAG: alpha/beta hydrolase [Spirochaetaceae bacterium]|nr:alpha/beta hydrolase [Spirochaetaceae bacterium]